MAKGLHYLAGNMASHWRAAGMHSLDGFEQFLTGRQLEQIPTGSGGQGVKHALGVLIDRQHDELNYRMSQLDLAHALDAIHARQINVHEHDIRSEERRVGKECRSRWS